MTSLKTYNTFGIDVSASTFYIIRDIDTLCTINKLHEAESKRVLGGGSNILFTKNVTEVLLKNEIKGRTIVHENDDEIHIKFGGGESWHETVLYCIEKQYGGIENLSLIPGTVGASPIQNIGAYGIELKNVFESCEVFLFEENTIKTFSNKECAFSYRESIFKNALKNKVFITSVTLRLTKRNHKLTIDYGDIKQTLNDKHIFEPTIKDISDAVIEIREKKLPNPILIGNCGSFFKNPEIKKSLFETLKITYPLLPGYSVTNPENIKVAAGWLIEQCGLKGYTIGGAAVHDRQALVLINKNNATAQDAINLANYVQQRVFDTFGITISPEVNIW